jgi:hypothetical protein
MNKTIAFIVLAVLVALVIAGYVVLAVLDRDPSDFTATAVMLLGLAATAAGLQTGLQKIEKQTNGTLSGLLERNQQLEAENSELRERFTAETGIVSTVPHAQQQQPAGEAGIIA